MEDATATSPFAVAVVRGQLLPVKTKSYKKALALESRMHDVLQVRHEEELR
jgi:hypothetical protein